MFVVNAKSEVLRGQDHFTFATSNDLVRAVDYAREAEKKYGYVFFEQSGYVEVLDMPDGHAYPRHVYGEDGPPPKHLVCVLRKVGKELKTEWHNGYEETYNAQRSRRHSLWGLLAA